MALTTESDFKQFYEISLQSDLKELEIRRLTVANRVRTLLIFELIIFIVIMIYAIWFRPEKETPMPGPDLGIIFWIIGSLVILGVIFVFITARISKKFRKLYKQNIIGKLITQISEDLTYFPEDKIEFNEFKNSRIYNQNIATYKGRDLVTGNLGKMNFRFSWLEVYARTMPDHRKKSQYHLLFRGIFFIADFRKTFSADAVIFPNVSKKFGLGLIGRLLQEAHLGSVVILDDPQFEKEYSVHSEQSENAKKLVTPGLRQWLIDFREKTKSQVFLSFTDTKMNMGVFLKRQLFEPPIFKKVDNYDYILENFRYLMLFHGLIEDMGKSI